MQKRSGSDSPYARTEAAIYLRLSAADGPAAESDSIQNQRAYLTNWAQDNGIVITQEFVDDGHTGTDFDRPGFQKLNACLMDGSVRCVIVKDLSRLGRNYAETGRYLEQIFPRLGVRFVAVNDQYDSACNTDTVQQIAVFKNVFNDFYAADASSKVRTSLGILKRQGKFLGRQAPYGYRIDPKDKYHLLPDEETAPVVQRIFALFLGGSSRGSIAKMLNREKVPSPAVQKGMTDKSRTFTGLWNAETVRRLLSHPVYQGDMAQQFTRTINYKVHKRRRMEPKDWVVVPDTHEPLVSQDDFALAQQMLRVRTYETTDHVHLLSGIVYCADCGSPMYAKKRGKYWYLNCYRYYRDPTAHQCTSHSIREDLVLQTVLDALQNLARGRIDPKAEAGRRLESRSYASDTGTRCRKLEKQMETARRARLNAYKDKAAGTLNEEEFAYISHELRREEERCISWLHQLQQKKEVPEERSRLEEKIKNFMQFRTLNKVQLRSLVCRVEVDNQKNITVEFTFKEPTEFE